MYEKQLQVFLEDIEDKICYIMDGYYSGVEVEIISEIEAKLRLLGAGDTDD